MKNELKCHSFNTVAVVSTDFMMLRISFAETGALGLEITF